MTESNTVCETLIKMLSNIEQRSCVASTWLKNLSCHAVLRLPVVAQRILKHTANTREYKLQHIPLLMEAQPAKASKTSDLIYTGAVYLQFVGQIFLCLMGIKVRQHSLCLKISLGLLMGLSTKMQPTQVPYVKIILKWDTGGIFFVQNAVKNCPNFVFLSQYLAMPMPRAALVPYI